MRGIEALWIPRFVAWGVLGTLACGAAAAAAESYSAARERMVRDDIAAGGVTDPRVLESLRTTPRHEFVPAAQRPKAYLDMALPIGEAQTISGPLVVAVMTEQLRPQPDDRVLEIGTGSGYQAAVLAPLVKTVYSIEIEKPLADKAARTLARLGYENIVTKTGDGFQGWPEHAPFDGIIVTCSPEDVPQPLLDQLADGGRMVIPVGERFEQRLVRITRRGSELIRETIEPTLFVPMTGVAEESRRVQPDGGRPALRNGGFEELVEGGTQPVAWYYGRQCEVLAEGAGEGSRALRFRNAEPGRPAQVFQGFAVDGGRVRSVRVRAKVSARGVIAGRTSDERPCFAIRFLDADRRRSAAVVVGPWSGDFGWTDVENRIDVPPWAREGSLMIGMAGATGTFDVDAVTLDADPR